MATYTNYDLDDPQVRQLVNDRHVITEQKVTSNQGVSLTVICVQCGTDWPCQILTDLRAWVAANPAA